eukprot:2243432-Pleurochrysis_carterae.AAC.1
MEMSAKLATTFRLEATGALETLVMAAASRAAVATSLAAAASATTTTAATAAEDTASAGAKAAARKPSTLPCARNRQSQGYFPVSPKAALSPLSHVEMRALRLLLPRPLAAELNASHQLSRARLASASRAAPSFEAQRSG